MDTHASMKSTALEFAATLAARRIACHFAKYEWLSVHLNFVVYNGGVRVDASSMYAWSNNTAKHIKTFRDNELATWCATRKQERRLHVSKIESQIRETFKHVHYEFGVGNVPDVIHCIVHWTRSCPQDNTNTPVCNLIAFE